MKKNPLSYGIPWDELAMEPDLLDRRKTLITNAARELERSKMARFDERSGNLYVTDLGRVASHFYIRHSSIVVFNEHLKSQMTEAEVCPCWWILESFLPEARSQNLSGSRFCTKQAFVQGT